MVMVKCFFSTYCGYYEILPLPEKGGRPPHRAQDDRFGSMEADMDIFRRRLPATKLLT